MSPTPSPTTPLTTSLHIKLTPSAIQAHPDGADFIRTLIREADPLLRLHIHVRPISTPIDFASLAEHNLKRAGNCSDDGYQVWFVPVDEDSPRLPNENGCVHPRLEVLMDKLRGNVAVAGAHFSGVSAPAGGP